MVERAWDRVQLWWIDLGPYVKAYIIAALWAYGILVVWVS